MGYRSNVAISLSKESYEILKEWDKENKDLRELLEIAEIKESNNVVVLHWSWIKWYDCFPEVQAINDFLSYLGDSDKSFNYIIIGEDSEDVETWSHYGEDDDNVVDAIGVYRDIDINI